MVCMVVLSAAALASQTHYSYLNEFSLAPYPLSPPTFRPPLPLSLALVRTIVHLLITVILVNNSLFLQ